MSPKRGMSFEGFVIEEIIRALKLTTEDCFYWCTHAGVELDHLYVVHPGDLSWSLNNWATALSILDLINLEQKLS